MKLVQQFEQEHSGCVGDDLFDVSEDFSCIAASNTASDDVTN